MYSFCMEECVKGYLASMESEKSVLWNRKKDLALAYMQRRLKEVGDIGGVQLHTGYSIAQFSYVSGGIMSSVVPRDGNWFSLTTYGAGSGKKLERSFNIRTKEEEKNYGLQVEGKKQRKEQRKRYQEDIKLITDTDGAMDFFEYCTQMVLMTFLDSGYYDVKTEVVKDSLCTGIGYIAIEEDEAKKKIWYQCLSPKECCYRRDENGKVDSFGRRWKMSAYDIFMHWGKERCPKVVLDCIKNGNTGNKFEVCEIVVPQGVLYDDSLNKIVLGKESDKYAVAIWISETSEYIFTGSTNRMPIAVMMFEGDGDNQYGKGMVENAIDSIIDLDEMEKERQILRKRTSNPPWAVHSSISRTVSFKNDALNVVPSMDMIPQPIQMPNNYSELLNDIESKKAEIRQLLFVDVFQTLMASNDTRRTAAEVNLRKMESAQLMQQAIGNMEGVTCTEVMQTLGLLMMQGKIASPSEEVAKLIPYLTMIFSSSFIQMKNSFWMAEGNAAFVNFVIQLAGVYPDIMDIIDMDIETQMIAVAYGQSQYAIREKSEIEEIRKQKAELAQMQMQMQMQQMQSQTNMNNAKADQAYAQGQQAHQQQ